MVAIGAFWSSLKPDSGATSSGTVSGTRLISTLCASGASAFGDRSRHLFDVTIRRIIENEQLLP